MWGVPEYDDGPAHGGRQRRSRGDITTDPVLARPVRVCAPAAQRLLVPKAEAIGFRKGEEVQWPLEKEALVLRRITRKR